jgi:secreted PhoX family phosphatase
MRNIETLPLRTYPGRHDVNPATATKEREMRSNTQKALVAVAATLSLATGAVAQTFAPFTPIDLSANAPQHIVPASPLQSAILLRGLVDTATNHLGQKHLAKDWADFTGYIPINGRSDSGYVIINNERVERDTVGGDGGGMTVFTAQFKNNTWSVADHPNGKVRTVNFGPVGGTVANCGGMETPWGTVLTAEEWNQGSNASMFTAGVRDTSDWNIGQFNGEPSNRMIKRHQNMNWMVEVNPVTGQAIKKHYNMGRFDHEGGTSMPDGKTVYLTDDATPAVFFKFVSDTVGNYNKGQLFAYQQTIDGNSGSWIALPMDIDTMINARAVAIRRGATLFTRLEWSEHVDGKLYIAETGADNSGTAHRNGVRNGGKLALHLAARLNNDSSITDYYGRVLRFDVNTNKMDVLIEGGAGTGGNTNHLSNPDGLTSVELNGKKYLVIQEDLIGLTQGRVPPAAASANRYLCEIYWLDLSIANPTVNDLKRMLIGANGSEVTGARFTPDGKTMFVNIQHPSSSNAAPYNTSYTLAVWGYAGQTTNLFEDPTFENKSGRLEMQVNPMSRFAFFNEAVDVELYTIAGKRLERHKKIRQLDVAHLNAGQYFVRLNGRDMHKLVMQ